MIKGVMEASQPEDCENYCQFRRKTDATHDDPDIIEVQESAVMCCAGCLSLRGCTDNSLALLL